MTDVPFAKYEATGNDFIVIAARDLGFERRGGASRARRLVHLARAILARHTGVGADGLFVVWPPADPKHQAAVQIFNADGSEAEMSGNGIRCAAAWLMDCIRPRSAFDGQERLLDPAINLSEIRIETAAGLKELKYQDPKHGETFFRVAMGKPILEPKQIPFGADGVSAPVVRYPLPTSIGSIEVTVTSMGNPHCSTLLSSLDDLDWRALGREIERHPLFPNRTNVEFVRAVSRREIEVRFWERGVGETASSGTGSSAAAVAAALNGLTDRSVTVKTPGGDLHVKWSSDNQILLTGPVRHVASGTYEYDDRSDFDPH
ncbi:MAG TPA: diaminopimelate epimerase [Terriglobia bacterium]